VSIEPLSSLDRSTLRERALAALRSAITSGRYRPGDHLGEVELAGNLGISRGTVREALRHLQQEGLVVAGPRGMLRVNQLSTAEVRELFKVRAALEGLAVREIIASPRREEAIDELRRALPSLGGAEFADRVEADLAFHLLLCRLSRNSMLVQTWRGLEGRIRVAIMNGDEDRGSAGMMTSEHHAPLVEALERAEPDAAVAVVDEHMRGAAEHFAPLD
jgi:DNA-binding GntR family transcriptional regulator